jgi:hypothetical protein
VDIQTFPSAVGYKKKFWRFEDLQGQKIVSETKKERKEGRKEERVKALEGQTLQYERERERERERSENFAFSASLVFFFFLPFLMCCSAAEGLLCFGCRKKM